MGKSGIVGLICCGVSLILTVVSTALPYWVQYKKSNYVATSGLWMYCSKGYEEEEAQCREIKVVQEYYLAVRALVLMGLSMAAIANVLGFVGILVIPQIKNISLVAGYISITAGICMLTGAIVFAGRTSYLAKGYFVQFHVGFPFSLVAGIVGIVAGRLFIRAMPFEENQSNNPL
ncbi:hypothetical protein ACJMK2_003865 [Sinanodonta woodiana]|uniref:Claudin n=1 Tax=Sinanodonta woodiana TaxID=1069815 RepID=A0ABD3Y2F2_SINWO